MKKLIKNINRAVGEAFISLSYATITEIAVYVATSLVVVGLAWYAYYN